MLDVYLCGVEVSPAWRRVRLKKPVQNIVTKAVTQTDEHFIGSSVFKARFALDLDVKLMDTNQNHSGIELGVDLCYPAWATVRSPATCRSNYRVFRKG